MNNLKVCEQMIHTKEFFAKDRQSKQFVGSESVKEYNFYYKNINRIQQQNLFFKQKPSAFTEIITKQNELNLLPVKMGLIKSKGDNNRVDISNLLYGDKYMDVLSKGMKNLSDVRQYNLKQNRINEMGAQSILTNLTKNVRELDLQSNNIGRLGCHHLGSIIGQKNCMINSLNLENNKLGDSNIRIILNQLVYYNKSIKVLNISNNFLTDQIADTLKEVMSKNFYLNELYLHWNNLKAIGAAKLFEGLLETDNETLKVLDISWNNLGEDRDPRHVGILCEMLARNKNIVHFDLSNNNFTLQESIQISEALKKNQTIYGFHFNGNFGYVDSLGYLVVDENSQKDQNLELKSQRIKGVQRLKTSKRVYGRNIKNVCWICDGWKQQDFSWTLIKSGYDYKPPGFIYLDFMGFEPLYLEKYDQQKQSYDTKIMVPTDQVYFYYSFKNQQTISRQFEKVYLNSVIKQQNQHSNIHLQKINSIATKYQKDIISNIYHPEVDVVPRNLQEKSNEMLAKSSFNKWDIEKSIFYESVVESKNIQRLKDCFDLDIKYSQIQQIIKNEDDFKRTFKQLWLHYKYYIHCFKYIQSYLQAAELVGSYHVNFIDFIHENGLVGQEIDRDVANRISDKVYDNNSKITTISSEKKGKFRFELMELLVRICYFKFIKKEKSYENSIIYLLKNGVLDNMKRLHHLVYKWRTETYHSYYLDLTLKHYQLYIDQIYDKLKGQDDQLDIVQYMNMSRTINIYQDHPHVQDIDVALCFYLSRSIEPEYIIQTDILSRSICKQQFYEAISRLADLISLTKVNINVQLSLEDRKNQSIHYKLESLIHFLAANYLHLQYKIDNISDSQQFTAQLEQSDLQESLEEGQSQQQQQ